MAKGILNVGGGVVSVDASGNFTVETGLIADGASVFNETGVDVDFRVESDDNANMLFVDGGNDRVGIGVATPAAQLEVEQGSTGGVVAFTIDNNDTDKVAMSIEAANIDAHVMDITADAVTTARGINISADGLTNGSALYIDSDSSSNNVRSIASIIQNNTGATSATALSLQSDAGRGLFIDSNLAAGGYSLEIDAEQTTSNTAKIASVSTSGTTLEISAAGVLTGSVIDITADAATTGKGINMSMDALTTGSALYIDSNSGSTSTRNIASIMQNHASATGATALYLQSDAGRGLFIDSNLAAGGPSLEIDSEHTTTNAISINSDPTTTGYVMDISADGLTTGSALKVDSDSSSTGTRSLVQFTQNHVSGVNTTALEIIADSGRGLFIDSNLAAGKPSLEIDSEHTTANTAKIAAISTSGTTLEISSVGVLTGKVIDITADAATTGKGINMSMDGLTTGAALYIDSDSSSTSARNLVEIINNNTAATGATALKIQQDSSGDAIVCQGGNIRVTKGGSAYQTSLHHAWVMGG